VLASVAGMSQFRAKTGAKSFSLMSARLFYTMNEKIKSINPEVDAITAHKLATKDAKKKDERSRNWTFVAYPESVPPDWREILTDMRLQWIESPLHDKCLNPDGTAKKAHWHIVLIFQTKKSYEQIKEISDAVNAPIPQVAKNLVGVIRYMAHLDNPEKTQYSVKDIKAHGGADVARFFKITSTSRYAAIAEMMEHVDLCNIREFHTLMRYAMKNRYDDWFPLLCDNSAYVIGQYIKSIRHEGQAETPYLDPETGEILS
jgi:phenylpropionate dioxygenase-like ring-hydroxylating dioxygenase large terminal subunit